jgi:parallel beta-helix repeat protein
MRKLLFLLVIFISIARVQSQTQVVFSEDFELPSLGDSVQSSTNPAGGGQWTITTNLKNTGSRADSVGVTPGYATYLTTNSFSTLGKSKVVLQFAHICKLFYSDGGQIQYSIDGGTTWIQLLQSQYLGSGTLINHRFSESSYSADWYSGDTITKPNNSWWKTERYDLSSVAANQANVKIRFWFVDGGIQGAEGRYGWLIDDIKVFASDNELTPPSITLKQPVYKDTIYVTGPFDIDAFVKDSSGVSNVQLIYNINGGANLVQAMTHMGDSTYETDIPSIAYNNVVNYRVVASDIYNNVSSAPSSFNSFLVKKGSPNIQIGTTTTSGLFSPIYIASSTSTYLYSYNAMLFTKSEIKSGGTIESFAFNKTDAQGYTLGNATLRIYAKGVPIDYVPQTFTDYLAMRNGAIKVYENTAQNLNTTAGWQTFTCNTGSLFNYTGAENLMLFVEWYRPGNATGAVNWQINTAVGMSSCFYGASSVPDQVNTTGQRANIKINFQSSNAAIDATVLNFTTPQNPALAGQNIPVGVRIKNLGSTNLTQANVHWSLDGVYQGVEQWVGVLPQDFVSSTINLGTINLTVGPHTLKAWTSMPNGVQDESPSNDTISYSFFACQNLTGTFTVGTPTSDFPTIADVFTALNNCGISGPVTFKLASGTYNQQLIFPLFNNVSATNTITFESASGNPDSVVFQYNAAGTADNFVLRFEGSRYIKVKNITFKSLNSTNGRVVELANGASFNTVEGCKLLMPPTTSTTVSGIYNASSTYEHGNIIKNNIIQGGYYGIYFYGASSNKEKGNYFEGNTITNFYYYGMYLYYQDSTVAIGNTISNPTNTTAYGLYSYYTDNTTYLKNRILMNASTTNYCMYLYYNNQNGGNSLVANNFVSQSVGTSTVYGIYSYASSNMKYYYNSVNVTAGTTSGYAFYVYGASSTAGVKIKNNNFVNTGGGYAYYISTTAAVDSSNYNNIFATGNFAYWGAARANLAALQAASGKDQNSVSMNPQYSSVTDLHINNYSLVAIGTPTPEVSDDIDGELRSVTPTIGADEISIPTVDAGIFKINNPQTMITSLNQDIKVTIRTIGTTPLTSAVIKWSVNGVMQTPYNWTGYLPQFAVDSLVIANYTFNLGISTIKVWTESPNNSVDGFPLNDTATLTLYACGGPLSGNYTIGPNGDYTTFNNAIMALNSCGIDGAVIFEVSPGIYNEQLNFNLIQGVSATNTITFVSANNDSTSVIVDAGANSLGNFAARFNAAQYITIEKITLRNTIVTGRVIDITNASKYITIKGCIIQSSPGSTSSTSAGVYSGSTKDDYITLRNNQISGGYYGIYLYGVSTSSKEVGNTIEGNNIVDFYYYGMYLYYQDSIKVISNIVRNASNSGVVYAMYSYYSDNGRFLKNDFRISGTSSTYIMYFYYNNNSGGNSLVANNFVSQSVGTSTVYGLYSYTSSNMNYYYNSVNITKGSTSGYAFYITGGSNCNLVNNILVNTGGGYAYYASSTTALSQSNYNNIYTTGANYAYWGTACANLTALKAASGKDQNSIAIDPIFYSVNDLHTDNVGLFAKGTSISAVTDDIDGQTRAAIPCIGADEFIVFPNDARLKAVYTFGKLPNQVATPHQVRAIIKNMGSNNLNNLNVTLNITGSNTFTNVKTISTLLSGAEDTITFDGFIPSSLGLNNVNVSLPNDDNLSNNVFNYRQEVTDSLYAYADTTAPSTYLGFNTGSGLFVAKYNINGSRLIHSVDIYITNSNTVGQRMYAVVLGTNGDIIDTSYSKIITANDVNKWVNFVMANPSSTLTTNNFVYVGLAQTVGTGGYYPLGCQKEEFTRRGAFYYTTNLTGGSLIETTQFGRFMIQANLALPANYDASMAELVSPQTNCGLGNETVVVKVLNSGIMPIYGSQHGLTVYYALRNANNQLTGIVMQAVNDTILPAQTKNITFATPVNIPALTADSNYRFVTWVKLNNDPFLSNDTLNKIVRSKFTPPAPIVNSPVNVGFGYSATLTAISNDTVQWFANINDTVPIYTGATYITPALNSSTTYYARATTSSGSAANIGLTAVSTHSGGGASPSYGPELYNDGIIPAYGSSGTGIWGWTSTNGWIEYTWTTPKRINKVVFYKDNRPMSTCTFQYWNGTSYVDFYSYNNSAVQDSVTFPVVITTKLRFNNIAGSSNPNFREIQVFESLVEGCSSPKVPVVVNVVPAFDARVSEIITPNSGCGLNNQQVKIKIKNTGNLNIYGNQNVLTASYGLRLNNNIVNVVTQQVTDTLLAGDSLTFTFNTPLTLVATNQLDSNYKVVSWTTLLNDINPNNDSTTKNVLSKYTPPSPSVSNVTVNYGSPATFTIPTNDSIYWYANAFDTVPIFSGNTFTTPPLYDTTTYYVAAGQVQLGPGPSQFVGPLDNTIGSGGTIGATSYSQIFDVLSPTGITILKVDVYPATAGSAFTMVIKNSGGTVIQSYSGVTTVANIKETIPVNFQVPAGTGYQLGYTSGPSFYRNTSGAVYPYTIPGVISITGNTFSSGQNYWYNAYKWEVSVGMTGSVATGCASAKVPATAYVTGIPALDIAVNSISEPVGNIQSGVSTPVRARIINYGTTTVNSATINWSVNGVVQTPATFTGLNLANGQVSAPLLLGNFTFAGGPSTIKAWTSQPNNQTDMFPANDTASSNVMGCMSGNFTIGTGGTFPTFTAALNAINTVGICGNVIFDVLPGTYNEALVINQINNMGPNVTLTFRSQNGNNTSVILTNSTGNAVITLNGADYVRFEKMSIIGTGSITAAVSLTAGATNNIFDGNIIEIPTATSSTYRAINSTSTGADNYNQFINNRIKGGYYCVYWYGSSTLRKVGNQFINNVISDFYYYGLYLYYNDSLTISRNTIMNAPSSGSVYGLYSYYTDKSIFTKNKVMLNGSSTNYCMYFYYNNNSSGSSLVANNFVSQSIGTGVYGIYNYYSNNINYYYNSVNVTGGTSSYYAFYSSGGSNNNVVNNIFSNTGGGYAYYISTVAGINQSNYNNFYVTGSNLAYWNSAHANLASLKAASGKDQNSLSVNPNFNSVTDLHLVNFDLDGKATPIPSITDDIDGDLRSTTPDIGADEFILPDYDAGVTALLQPTSPANAGLQNIKIQVKNFGQQTLSSVNIFWSVNGVMQTPFAFNTNIAFGSTDTVTIGTYNFTSGVYNFKIWTNMPNGYNDQLTVNDTLNAVVVTCGGPLSGNYTIGGAGSNYLTINNAIQSLINCGVNGPVVFNIQPGNYNEQINIPAISGASAVNTITFKSQNNDSSSVIITFAPTSSNANYVIKLDGADFIRFKNLSIINNTQSTLGRVIELTNQANSNEFTNNVIQTPISTSSSTAGIYSYNTKDERNLVANNLIKGGYYGVYFYGVGSASGSKEIGNTIINNVIEDYYYYGIYLYYQDSVTLIGNSINNSSISNYAYGIYSYYCDNNRYLKNKVRMTNNTYTYGIYMYYNNNGGGNGIVANNFISQSVGINTVYLVYSSTSSNIKYYYNSLNVTLGTSTSYAMYFTGGSGNVLRNNSIVNVGNGYTIYASSTTAISSSNYNNLYTSGATLAYWGTACSNLAAWKTASNQDANSVSEDPSYTSTHDLHVYIPTLNNIGTPVPEITDDIDGQLRSTTTPDIGADEYTPLPVDLGVTEIYEPSVAYSPVGSNVIVKVKIKNFGADSINNFQVVYRVGNGQPVSYTYTGYLLSNKTDTVIFSTPLTVIPSAFTIKAYTITAGDGNNNNDTAMLNYFGVPIKSIPYFENFDNNNIQEWFITGGLNNQWERGVPNASVINSAYSSPNVWATKLNGNYANNSYSVLYTPMFNNSIFKVDTLIFRHWVDAENNKDGGSIEYLNNAGAWKPLGSNNPNDTNAVNWYNSTVSNMWTGSTNGWVESKYKIFNLPDVGANLQFRFIFTTDGTNNQNGWAIDNFQLTLAQIPYDAGVVNIVSPTTSNLGDTIQPVVTIKNHGLTALTSIPVKYSINGQLVATENWTGSLAPGATTNYTFTQKYKIMTQPSYKLCAWTALTNDYYVGNDSSCNIISVGPSLKDVGVTAIINPRDTMFPGSVVQVKIVIKNFGSQPVSSVPVYYKRGSIVYPTETWTGTPLNMGDTAVYVFSNTFNVPLGGQFAFSAYTELPGDAYPTNDVLIRSIAISNSVLPSAAGNITSTAAPYYGDTVCYNTTVPYSVELIPNATSYSWNYTGTGVTINGGSTNSITITFSNTATDGILTVKGVNSAGEGQVSQPFSIKVLACSGINDSENDKLWLGQNMPNPTSADTKFEYYLPSDGDVTIEVINLLGQTVYNSTMNKTNGKHTHILDVSTMPDGIYYYSLTFKGNRLVKRMVVNK